MRPRPTLPLGAVLAGGQSRRFGSDKSAHQLEGRPFLDWVLDAVDAAGLPVAIVGGSVRHSEVGPTRTHIADAPGLIGPLAGLAAALSLAEREGRPGVVMLACDQPGMTARVIEALVDRAGAEPLRPAAYEGDTGVDPFPGYYPVGLVPLIADVTSLRSLLKRARPPTWVFPRDGRGAYPAGTFDNVNTPEDLERFVRRRRP